MTKTGFISRYGKGETPLRLSDLYGYGLDSGNVRLVFDDGSVIECNYSQPHGFNEDVKKYMEYGVRNIIKKYSAQEIYIGEVRMTIKEARTAAGLTQKGFSQLFKIPIDDVKSWDSGRRKPPAWAEKLIIEKLESMKNPSE